MHELLSLGIFLGIAQHDGWIITECVDIWFFFLSSAIVNNAARNMGIKYLFESLLQFFRVYTLECSCWIVWSSPVVLVVKNPPANAGVTRDADSIPGLGRSP